MKKTFYSETAYLAGILLLAVGTAALELADFGMSMIVAPAYLLHLKVSQYWDFFSFGMAEYVFQAALILLTALLLRRVKISYLFSFATAVVYGFILDGTIWLLSWLPWNAVAFRVVYFAVGEVLCTAGVSMMFHTYISPEAYELVVKEVAEKWNLSINKVKTGYDLGSLVLSVIMSFLFFGFGHFEGIHWGTLVCALINGWLIGKMTVLFERVFAFKDGLPLRKVFEK